MSASLYPSFKQRFISRVRLTPGLAYAAQEAACHWFAAGRIVYSGSILCLDNLFIEESLFCVENDMQMN